MPTAPGEGGDPYAETVTSERPAAPVYVQGDENATPDVIIVVNKVERLPIWNWAKQGHDFINTTRFAYRCFRKYNSANRNHWKIEITVKGTDANGKARIYKLYPFGSAGYNFDPADISWYNLLMTKF